MIGAITRRALAFGVVMTVALVAVGCGDDGPDRGSVLVDLADDTIVPAYVGLAANAEVLGDAVTALCERPDDDARTAARTALAEVRQVWSFTEAMWVGPVMERRSWAVIDWPIAADEIEELIGDESVELTVEHLATRIGADQRGLQAVEYVLYEPAPGDTGTVLDSLADDRRCDYLTGVTRVIVDEAALLPDDWSVDFEGGGPYRDDFVRGAGGEIDSMVNDIAFLLEAMTDAELGVALGEMEQAADPDAVVDGPAGLGLDDLIAHLDGVRAVLVGQADAPGSGLSPLLGDGLTGRLEGELAAADAALRDVPPPLRTAVVETPDAVVAARTALKAVQVTLTTEVVSRLGVTIGFSDADGDTGG